MLKAYAVAVALSTTAPASASDEVENKPMDNGSQKAQAQETISRHEMIASQDHQIKKGRYRRRGGVVIIMP